MQCNVPNKRAGAAAGGKTVKLITGKGNHSRDGPRLLPRIIQLLEDKGHRFQVDQGGGHLFLYLPPPGDEQPEGDPGPLDRGGRQGSSSEGSPQRRSSGPNEGEGPKGMVLGDFLRAY